MILKSYVASVKKEMEFRIQIGDTKIPFNFVAEFILGAWSSLVPVFLILSIVSVFTDNYMIAIDFIKSIGADRVIAFTGFMYIVGQIIAFFIKI